MGGSFSYGSTGGRIYYSDYSGSLWFDQLLSNYSFACIVGKSVDLGKGKFSLQGDIRPGITITNLKLTGNEILGSKADNFSNSFRGVNLTAQPTLSLVGKFGKVSLNAFVGYNFALQLGDLTSTDNSGGTLVNNHDQKIYADWSGLRAGGGLSFQLRSKPQSNSQSQTSSKSQTPFERFSFGPGLGLDNGGIGVNATIYATKNLGFFIGGGYVIAGTGYNSGIKIRMTDNPRTKPYISAMYGYNAAIAISNNTSYNKIFYGPSIGFGVDRIRQGKPGYWTYGIIIPFRGTEVDNYINYLKSQGVQTNNSLTPITLSVGYRFVIK
ncbi:MAG: hypothetical protein QM734_15175 [Cyclobacteriaceae bacterium]